MAERKRFKEQRKVLKQYRKILSQEPPPGQSENPTRGEKWEDRFYKISAKADRVGLSEYDVMKAQFEFMGNKERQRYFDDLTVSGLTSIDTLRKLKKKFNLKE